MRCTLILAAAVGAAVPAVGQPFPGFGQPRPGYGDPLTLVDGWYRAYLGRTAVDDQGSRFWVERLQEGIAAASVEAGILGSDEYYGRNGNDLSAWVRAVHRDALGRQATPQEVDFWGRRAYTQGLQAVATEVVSRRPAANNTFRDQPQAAPPQNYDYRRPYYPYQR